MIRALSITEDYVHVIGIVALVVANGPSRHIFDAWAKGFLWEEPSLIIFSIHGGLTVALWLLVRVLRANEKNK
ncbi:MAG: hypothetical protein OXP69_17545 [Spirochaetaceae bacterium]|nr:hypothetical protein [Spirochaetaceae bacterium]